MNAIRVHHIFIICFAVFIRAFPTDKTPAGPTSSQENVAIADHENATFPVSPIQVEFFFDTIGEDTYHAPSHVATCPTGYTNMGLTCFKGMKTYSKCCTVAWSKCPCRAGWTNMGCHCHKDAHSMSNMWKHACDTPGEKKNAPKYFQSKLTTRCHAHCRAGYTNTGEYCTQLGQTCIQAKVTTGGKSEVHKTRNCCACGKASDGHLKESIQQDSMDQMKKWIAEQRKKYVRINEWGMNKANKGQKKRFQNANEKLLRTSEKAVANVEGCVRKNATRQERRGSKLSKMSSEPDAVAAGPRQEPNAVAAGPGVPADVYCSMNQRNCSSVWRTPR